MLVIILRVKLNPRLAPSAGTVPTWGDKFRSLKSVWSVILVFLMVMGSMYVGVCTPTEAGALGAFVLFIIAAAKGSLTWKRLIESLLQTAKVSAMIFVIVYGAMLFSSFLALSQIPTQLAAYIGGLEVSRYIVLILIILLFLVLGFFIESIPLIILAMPIVYPIAVTLQFDPVWFGVISVMMIEAALITPPVGLNVYVTAGTVKDIPVSNIFRNAFPYLSAIFIMITILAIFPDICLFIPKLIME
jgi:tripartite ATP-independent transporter DctM subunit